MTCVVFQDGMLNIHILNTVLSQIGDITLFVHCLVMAFIKKKVNDFGWRDFVTGGKQRAAEEKKSLEKFSFSFKATDTKLLCLTTQNFAMKVNM